MKRPITILFDAHPLLGQKTGIGYYVNQLILELSSRYPDDIELIGYYHNFLNRKKIAGLPRANNIKYRPITPIPGQLVNLLRRVGVSLPIELLTFKRADLIFYTNFWGPISIFKTPSVPFIYDLSFYDHPEFGSNKNMSDLYRFVPRAVKRSAFLVTISDFSKNRLIEVYGVQPQKVIVTYIPPPKTKPITGSSTNAALKKYNLTKPFLLFVGTLEPRKNLVSLLDAYTKLPKSVLKKYSLVVAGKIDWKYEETVNKIDCLVSSGYNIKYLGYIDDSVKNILYNQADLFVLPSVYEGFGMPVLEAFSYNLPCAISDIPVFREIAADNAFYFDASSPTDISKAIKRALDSPRGRTISLKQYTLDKFSWREQAAVLIDMCKRTVR